MTLSEAQHVPLLTCSPAPALSQAHLQVPPVVLALVVGQPFLPTANFKSPLRQQPQVTSPQDQVADCAIAACIKSIQVRWQMQHVIFPQMQWLH